MKTYFYQSIAFCLVVLLSTVSTRATILHNIIVN